MLLHPSYNVATRYLVIQMWFIQIWHDVPALLCIGHKVTCTCPPNDPVLSTYSFHSSSVFKYPAFNLCFFMFALCQDYKAEYKVPPFPVFFRFLRYIGALSSIIDFLLSYILFIWLLTFYWILILLNPSSSIILMLTNFLCYSA